jgi:ribosomal-protein-alanine N-acetyltransferase
MTDDLDRIMSVMEAGFDPQWGEAWTRRQIADSLTRPTTHYVLVDVDGRRADGATAAGFALTRAAPGEEELLLIAVRPEHRRRGLGATLLAAVAEGAKSRGAERLFLEMRSNNPAISLYRAHGFEPIGERRDYYRLPDGRTLDAITFGRTL